MTAHRDLKRIIRARQLKTGESYTTARAHVMRERSALIGLSGDTAGAPVPVRVDAVVLALGERSARVRIVGEDGHLAFRSGDVHQVVPGQLITLIMEKRWKWRGSDHASGRIENPRIAVDKLGLVPLPLAGGELYDLRSAYERFRMPEPYALMWRKLTAKPRAWFEMDPIAWGALPGLEPEESPTLDAAELVAAGDPEGAREILMEVLSTDLRCIDAHAHLGNIDFDEAPDRAIAHYEIGKRIGELSLPPGFDGVLTWGCIYNRPFLRCLYGYGLCLWRLGKLPEALQVFERILSLNPNDDQCVRSCWYDVGRGHSWDETQERSKAAHAKRPPTLH